MHYQAFKYPFTISTIDLQQIGSTFQLGRRYPKNVLT